MSTAPAGPDVNDARRWLVLALVGVAQLTVVLDATIVNIALPSAQTDLGFDDDNRQWVVTAYALAFGSLLLLGGRIGDLFGRKQAFVVGLVGFAAASALGGAAGSFGVLVAARALQGVFGALLAPAALAILSVTFTDPAERGKAFGIYGAIAGVGAGIGLLLGGILTDALSWRWCLYVNLLFAIPVAVASVSIIRAHHRDRTAGGHRRGIDLPGALTATVGLFALVFGVSNAETNGWGDTLTIVALVIAPIVLSAFVLVERRAAEPLLPLRVVLDPARGGSYFAIAVFGIVLFGVFLFLTYFLQQNLRYTPTEAGLAFMPMNLTIIVVSGLTAGVLLPRFGPRPLIIGGLVLAAIGAAWFALRIDGDAGYAGAVLPGLLVIGVGGGFLFPTTFSTATLGVQERDTGVASAMLNTAQQVGGSIGIALLSTLFASAVDGYAADHPGPAVGAESVLHGYTTVFWWAAGLTFLGAVVAAVLVRTSREELASAPPVEGAGAGAH
ncbi:MFS transporter [Patulibacter brassicae]|uniref:MFS transporter n=1 Tax=Patulibacter brassicae TaxID=1705717 RepID=A0ABU4VPA5_9ACTN|nr:MFS transporter [Patulibacter brassicae]MDX8153682.1 MFS transporter [Patulibacter brassicae]